MAKNGSYIEITTHVGLTEFMPHFTTVECSAFLNFAGRVELFITFFYDTLKRTNSLELTNSSYNYDIGNSQLQRRKKVHGTNRSK